MLDKTVSHTVITAVGGSFVCFFYFFKTKFAYAPQSLVIQSNWSWMLDSRSCLRRARWWQGSTSCRWALVYYCFLPFTRLEARPAPELIGLWSRVNSRAHTAWQLPPGQSRQAGRQERLLQKVFQVKEHTRKCCFRPLDSHCGVWRRFCPQEPQPERVSCDIKIVIYIYIVESLY